MEFFGGNVRLEFWIGLIESFIFGLDFTYCDVGILDAIMTSHSCMYYALIIKGYSDLLKGLCIFSA